MTLHYDTTRDNEQSIIRELDEEDTAAIEEAEDPDALADLIAALEQDPHVRPSDR